MNEEYLKTLMTWAAKAPISEIEVTDGDFHVRLVKQAPAGPAPAPVSEAAQSNDLLVVTPLPGVFYHQATPDAPAFVSVGQTVRAGDTVGLVEAMKMFNPVASELDGTVDAILVQSGEDVTAGQPVLRLRATGSDRE